MGCHWNSLKDEPVTQKRTLIEIQFYIKSSGYLQQRRNLKFRGFVSQNYRAEKA